jgi:hypothetical protein
MEMTETKRETSAVGMVVAIVVLAAIVGMLLLVRGPEDQDRSGAVAPVATLTIRA